MPLTYNPKDVFIVQRNDSGSAFVETILRSTPNSVVLFDSHSLLTTLTTKSFSDTIISQSLADFTASYALVAKTAQLVTSANTASFLLKGANIYLSQSAIHSDVNASEPPYEPGQLYWDKADKTYAIDTDIAGVDIRIGQENIIRVTAGEFIPLGSAVYLSGSVGGMPVAFLALADSGGTKSTLAGVSSTAILIGNEGYITNLGVLDNLNTFLFKAGDRVYLSSTVPGGYQSSPPDDPFDKVLIGNVLVSDPTIGKILINISPLLALNNPYVGMIEVPTFTDHGNQTFTVGAARGSFCTTMDGLGQIKTYTIPQATFSASIGTFAQYVLGIYNSGSPVYSLTNNKSLIDEIQTIPVFSTITPVSIVNFVDWDAAGTLLANKQHLRLIQVNGAQRASGLILGTSGSYITLTSGSIWYGVKQQSLSEVNTSNTASFPLSFYSHTTGSWNTTAIPTGRFINGQYDNGTNLQTLTSGSYVINYVYRTFSNRIILTLSDQFTNLNWAEIASPPIPPSYFPDFTILVGRIIIQSGSVAPYQVNSLFDQVPFPPSEPPYHNGLQELQGGSGSTEFYHISSASFAKISAGQLDSASYLNPGATLFVVSGSDGGLQSSYIEPYNLPTIPYNPNFKEGRMFYDSDFHNWVYYTEQNFKLHIGKEVIFRIHNPFNTTLPVSTAVYLSGSTGGFNLPDAFPAIADGTGLHANPVGIVRSNISSGSLGYVLTNGVIHDIDVDAFQVGDTLWLSPTVLGGLQNSQPGSPSEAVRMGTCQQAGPSGSFFIRVITVPTAVNAYAGATILPTITNNNDGTIVVSSGSVNLFSDESGFGSVVTFPLTEQTLSLITGSTNYIIANYNTGSPQWQLTTDSTLNNGTTITRISQLNILTGIEAPWDIHEFDVGIVGLALANRINNKDEHLYGFQRESGLTLFTTGSNGHFGVTSGIIWYGPNSHTITDFNTTIPGNEAYHFFVQSSSIWNSHTQSIYDNTSFNGLGGLTPLAPDSWSVNFVYRIIADVDTDDVAIVLSSQQFSTELEASNNAVPPNDLPSTITDFGFLVGRFIVQSGSFANTVVGSTFSPLFVPAVVTNHENLLGLQGGAAGQHEHLTLLEYSNFQNATGTGVYVRQSGSILTGVNISGSITTSSFSSAARSASFTQTASFSQTASFANNSTATTLFTASIYFITASAAVLTTVFAGAATDISLIDNNNGTVTVSSSSVNLFSDFDGNGAVQTYFLPSASFPVVSGSANYIIANYNGGTPMYQITTDPSIINQTTIVPISVISNIRGEIRGYNYDNVGLALANRLNDRLSKTEKFTRQDGLSLFDTGSFIGVTQGTLWDGATSIPVNSFDTHKWADSNPIVNENYFYHHTSSLPPTQFIVELDTTASNKWVSNYFDDGTNLVPLSASWYVVNYVWRLVGAVSPDEDSSTVLGVQWQTLNEARNEAVPVAPTDVTELGILVGRAILQSGSSTPVLIESAFATQFQASTVTNHENLDGLEGGTVSQHYHLTQTEYTGTGTGAFVRQTGGIIINAVFSGSASITGSITTASFAQDAALADSATSASYSSVATTASWANNSPATTLFTASVYQITSSWSVFAVQTSVAASASFSSIARSSSFATNASTALSASNALTASFATNASNAMTASYANGIPTIKSGIVASSSFQGAPRTASITFTTPFANNNYSVVVTGESSRTWTIQNKVSGSFQINANNNGAIANNTFWIAMTNGEFGS